MLKREDLKVGDKVKCIDENGFKEHYAPYNKRILEHSTFIVKAIHEHNIVFHGDILGAANKITHDEYKFFEKDLSPIETLSFEGVLDLTVEAYKAGVINSMTIEHSRTPRIHISFNGGYRWFDSDKPECFEEYVDFIDSLYKESFVIESDSDIAKIKYGAEVELSNGNVGTAVVTAKASDMNVVKVEYDGGEESSYLNFFTLKGATVTQKRGW